MNSFRDLYENELADVYDAEQQLVKALPKMAEAASAPQLKRAFEDHLEQTRAQARRIEQIYQNLGDKPKSRTCKAMKGLIDEGADMINADAQPAIVDAGLIAAAQRVEHYEISAYGTARAFAEVVGDDEGARLLQQTLNEEKQTDQKLNELAKGLINPEAANV